MTIAPDTFRTRMIAHTNRLQSALKLFLGVMQTIHPGNERAIEVHHLGETWLLKKDDPTLTRAPTAWARYVYADHHQNLWAELYTEIFEALGYTDPPSKDPNIFRNKVIAYISTPQELMEKKHIEEFMAVVLALPLGDPYAKELHTKAEAWSKGQDGIISSYDMPDLAYRFAPEGYDPEAFWFQHHEKILAKLGYTAPTDNYDTD